MLQLKLSLQLLTLIYRLSVLILLVVLLKINAFDMHCSYQYTWDGYCCISVDTEIRLNKDGLRNLVGIHAKYRENSDVTCLSFHYSNVEYLSNKFYEKFKNLKSLVVYFSDLKSLERFMFSGAHKLEKLMINNNCLKKIKGNTFADATRLHTIDLKLNIIEVIDVFAFSGLKKLTILDLSFNMIKSIHRNTFIELQNIQKLSLSYNQLSTIDKDMFKYNYGLVEIYLGGNKIKTVGIPNPFSHLKKLRALYFESNLCIDLKFSDVLGIHDPKLIEAIIKCQCNDKLIKT